MYLFPDISVYLEKLMLSGLIFSSVRRSYLRLTFVTMSEQELEEGFKLLREYLEGNNVT